MANRQKVPFMRLGGAMLKRPVAAQITSPARRFLASDSSLYVDSALLEAANILADKMQKTEDERLAMQADVSLKATREALQNAATPDELQNMVKDGDKALAAQFDGDEKARAFWKKHGDNILAAHRDDTKKIVAEKQIDFGKQSLNSMLADNQNLLADNGDAAKVSRLLEMGTDEIQKTPFLTEPDKKNYRQGYLKTGILNAALNNPEAASRAVDMYVDDEAEKKQLKAQIQETKSLTATAQQQDQAKHERLDLLNRLSAAQSLWQQKEHGDISPAQYFVLRQKNMVSNASGEKSLQTVDIWGDDEERSLTPLSEVYRLVRKMNEGTQLSAQEISDASNYLINAYHQNKLGLEEVSALQNQLLAAQSDKPTAEMMFDKEVDALVDKAFAADLSAASTRGNFMAQQLMEDKAKFALDIYQNYYATKTALASSLQQNGEQLTPLQEKKISRLALDGVIKDMMLKTNAQKDAVTFGELKRALQSAYAGTDVARIWKKYASLAPFAEDKIETMRQIAREEQRKELNYPQFDSYEELAAADLAPGEKFYFQGRLAVMKG